MAGRRRGAAAIAAVVVVALVGACGAGEGRPRPTGTTAGPSGVSTTVAGDLLSQLAQLRADVDAVATASGGPPGGEGPGPPCRRLEDDLAAGRQLMLTSVEGDPEGQQTVTAAIESVQVVVDRCRAPGAPGLGETVARARQRLQAARDSLSQRVPA